jgi:hypothetical protein
MQSFGSKHASGFLAERNGEVINMGVNVTYSCDSCKQKVAKPEQLNTVQMHVGRLQPDGKESPDYMKSVIFKSLFCDACIEQRGLCPSASYMADDHPARTLTPAEKMAEAVREFVENVAEDSVANAS